MSQRWQSSSVLRINLQDFSGLTNEIPDWTDQSDKSLLCWRSEESALLPLRRVYDVLLGEKTRTVVPVKGRKMNWNISCKFLVENRGKRPINCDPKLVSRDSSEHMFNFPWAFKFRLDSPVAW